MTKGGLKAGCTRRQIMLELKEAAKYNFSDGQVVVELEEGGGEGRREGLFCVKVGLFPNDGVYEGGEWWVRMTMTENYPRQKPEFRFITPIFHPNVDEEGDICFNLLEEEDGLWASDEEERSGEGEMRIADYAHGLLFLLYYPNLFDPLNCECPTDEKEFMELVRESIEGGMVRRVNYERSKRLPKKEEEKEEGEGKGKEEEKKKWVWKLVDSEWAQVWE